MYDVASTPSWRRRSPGPRRGTGDRRRQLAAGGSRRSESRRCSTSYGIGLEDVRTALAAANANRPKGRSPIGTDAWTICTNDQLSKPTNTPADRRLSATARRCGWTMLPRSSIRRRHSQRRLVERQAGGAADHLPAARRQHHRDGRSRHGADAATAGVDSRRHQLDGGHGPDHDHSRFGARRRIHADHLDRAGGPGGFLVPARVCAPR